MQFDPLLTPPRLAILGALLVQEEPSFTELKHASGLRDGNLHVHVAKLVAAGYVQKRPVQRGARTVTLLHITGPGVEAVRHLARRLEQLLAQRGNRPEPRRPRKVDGAEVWLR